MLPTAYTIYSTQILPLHACSSTDDKGVGPLVVLVDSTGAYDAAYCILDTLDSTALYIVLHPASDEDDGLYLVLVGSVGVYHTTHCILDTVDSTSL